MPHQMLMTMRKMLGPCAPRLRPSVPAVAAAAVAAGGAAAASAAAAGPAAAGPGCAAPAVAPGRHHAVHAALRAPTRSPRRCLGLHHRMHVMQLWLAQQSW
eukprot:1159706-Pelagomonas_calceolata.AAC.11